MSRMYSAMVVLVLALASLVGYESPAVGEVNPIRVAEMQKTNTTIAEYILLIRLSLLTTAHPSRGKNHSKRAQSPSPPLLHIRNSRAHTCPQRLRTHFIHNDGG